MGIENLTGKIAAGCEANLLVLDQELEIQQVIFKGKLL